MVNNEGEIFVDEVNALKKDAMAEEKSPLKKQPGQGTKDQEAIETGSSEDKSPDDMEIFD